MVTVFATGYSGGEAPRSFGQVNTMHPLINPDSQTPRASALPAPFKEPVLAACHVATVEPGHRGHRGGPPNPGRTHDPKPRKGEGSHLHGPLSRIPGLGPRTPRSSGTREFDMTVRDMLQTFTS